MSDNFTGPLVHRRLLAKEAQQDKRKVFDYRNDLQWVMRSLNGRRLMYGIIFAICGIEEVSYVGDGPESMLVREGMRHVGVKLLKDLQEHCLPNYIEMLKEQVTFSQNQLREREEDRLKINIEKEE